MKGLILKDLYTLKKQFSFIGLYMVLIAVMSFMMDNPYTFIAVISMIVVMSPMTAMSYDHQCEWEKYADTLPLKRSVIVMSRYGLGMLLLIPVFLYDIIVNIISNRNFSGGILLDSVYISVIISGISIIALSFIMPFIFKFGVEKGRIIIILFCMVIGGALGAFLSIDVSEDMISILSNKTLLTAIVIASAVIVLSISIIISTKIYEKKEF